MWRRWTLLHRVETMMESVQVKQRIREQAVVERIKDRQPPQKKVKQSFFLV